MDTILLHACTGETHVVNNTEDRAEEFQRNPLLESLLDNLNKTLSSAETQWLQDQREKPQWPTLLVVGPPRGGTTLLMQWLASSGLVCYPSNLLSRFYASPCIGAMIQTMLFDPAYQYRDELALSTLPITFQSAIGKTTGALAPNVFWYFWRHHFRFGETSHLDSDQWNNSNTSLFVKELAGLEAIFNKPFAMKAMIMNWNLPQLDLLLPKAIYLNVVRDPGNLMLSIYHARHRFRGTADRWWSFKPPEYSALKNRPTLEQVAGFVLSIERAIQNARAVIPSQRWVDIPYEDFCDTPATTFRQIQASLSLAGYNTDITYSGEARFPKPTGNTKNDTLLQDLLATYHRMKETLND